MTALLDVDSRFGQIVDDLTRRGLLGSTLGGVAAVGLAACGTAGTATHTGTSASTRKVSTLHGYVEVPAKPTRIVALDFPEVCALLDLGIVPVGRPSYVPDFGPYSAKLKDVPVVTDASGLPVVEKVAALSPDLIVGDDWADPKQRRAPYQELSTIAPTTLFEWQQAAGNWPDLAAETAGAVNQSSAMTALKNKYDTRAAAIASKHAALFAATRWDLIDCSDKVWDLYSKASSHGAVLTHGGVRLTAGATQTTGFKEYSFERFSLLRDTDVIVTSTPSLPMAKKQPTFTVLPAVRSGRIFTTGLFFPASYGVALGLLDQLDAFCMTLKEKK